METLDYYARRAAKYEEIYSRPDADRLDEQEELARFVRSSLLGRDVLEVAAGTGFWTVHAAAVAKAVTATDASPETLEIARLKPLPEVRFVVADAYNPGVLGTKFDAALACFWLSHVPRSRLTAFVTALHSVLSAGSVVVMADNVFVADQGGEFVSDGRDDTYRMRALDSGESVEVLKNYFRRDELEALFGPSAKCLDIHVGRHFWWLSYHLAEDF